MMSSQLVFLLLFGIILALPAQDQITEEGRNRESLPHLLQQEERWNVVEGETSVPINLEREKLRTRREGTGRSLVITEPCGPIMGHCRLTYDGQGAEMNAVASCFCREGEDISEEVSKLSTLTCPLTVFWDNKTHNTVAQSTLSIKGCSIRSGVFPSELLERLRQTKSFHFHLESVPYARLPTVERVRTVPSVQGNIINSNVNGLHRGWFSKTQDLRFDTSNSDLGVIGSKAFTGYGSSAKAKIHIINSNITNIIENAFELPKSGEVLLSGVRLQNINHNAFSGGSVVHIKESDIMNLKRYAFNLHGIGELTLNYNTLGNVEHDVLFNQAPIDIRTGGISYNVRPPNVSIRHNQFVRLRGRSFQWLCEADGLNWINNTVIDVIDPPLRLQDDNCEKARDWDAAFSLNNMNCINCLDFDAYVDEQVCALYKTSYCYSCEAMYDACDKPLVPYISEKCKDQNESLEMRCASVRHMGLQGQNNGAVNIRVPCVFIIASTILILLITAEEHYVD